VRARGHDGLVERGVVGAPLLADVELPGLDAVAPCALTLDRRADLEARRVERSDLVVGPEDAYGHGATGALAQVVVIEVDAVRRGLELQPHRGRLARQVHLHEALALVRVDAALVCRKRCGGTSGPRKHAYGRADEPTPPARHRAPLLPRIAAHQITRARVRQRLFLV
jgi:hypothetical protein